MQIIITVIVKVLFFHVFHWSRAYQVRAKKLDCFPRINQRGRQRIIHGE